MLADQTVMFVMQNTCFVTEILHGGRSANCGADFVFPFSGVLSVALDSFFAVLKRVFQDASGGDFFEIIIAFVWIPMGGPFGAHREGKMVPRTAEGASLVSEGGLHWSPLIMGMILLTHGQEREQPSMKSR